MTNNVLNLMDSEEDDKIEGEEEENRLIKSSVKLASNADIRFKSDSCTFSIGKIKILKPKRRKIKAKTFYNWCISISILILLILICLIWFKRNIWLNNLSIKKTVKQRCSQIEERHVWHKTFPMLTARSSLRLIDVNNDTILDVIVAFGTGLDAPSYHQIACQIYFNQTRDSSEGCGGGVMALEGKTGKLLWILYTSHELFGVNCDNDITEDGINDCLVSGRMASLYAVNGANGKIIWSYAQLKNEVILPNANFYTPLYISTNFNHDNLPQIVLMHGGDPYRSSFDKSRNPARLIIASAKTGAILSWTRVPDNGESYFPPQKLTKSDGSDVILFGTGSETYPGSLFIISLDNLFHQNINQARAIYTDCCKGVMIPPVLIDINNDSVSDIIMSLFNSNVIAIDGQQYSIIWKKEFLNSESYSVPAVGYFNDDEIPDFLVQYQNGPGFPIYYYSQVTVLDGRNGKPLINPIKTLVGTQSSALTISTFGVNDAFLFWSSNCVNISLNATAIQYFDTLPGISPNQASLQDFCSIRFNSSLFNQLIGLTPTHQSVIYDSVLNRNVEKVSLDYFKITQDWLEKRKYNKNFNQINNYDLNQFDDNFQPIYDYSPNDLFEKKYEQLFKKRFYSIQSKSFNPIDMIQLKRDSDQKVLSTGTLAPSKEHGSIDVIFITFWLPSNHKISKIPLELQKCLNRYRSLQMENKLRTNQFKGLDHESYLTEVEKGCSKSYKFNLNQQIYDPLNRPMGSMTIYRKTIRCSNSSLIKPFNKQIWPSYMGLNANCIPNL